MEGEGEMARNTFTEGRLESYERMMQAKPHYGKAGQDDIRKHKPPILRPKKEKLKQQNKAWICESQICD